MSINEKQEAVLVLYHARQSLISSVLAVLLWAGARILNICDYYFFDCIRYAGLCHMLGNCQNFEEVVKINEEITNSGASAPENNVDLLVGDVSFLHYD